MAGVNAARIVGDDQRAPRGGPGAGLGHLGPPRPGGQLRAQRGAFGARHRHARIINQRGFVQRHVGAIGELDRDRGIGGTDRRKRGAVVEVFLAVPQERGLPPRGAVLRKVELGQLLGDICLVQICLVGEFETEAHPVVINAEGHGEHAGQRGAFLEMDLELAVMVADVLPLAPRLVPGLVEKAGLLPGERQVPVDLGHVGEQEAEARGLEDRAPLAADAVDCPAVAIGGQRDADRAVGRTGAGCGLRGGRHGKAQRRNGGQQAHRLHRGTPSIMTAAYAGSAAPTLAPLTAASTRPATVAAGHGQSRSDRLNTQSIT